MLQISDDALSEGCDRARDLFLLNRLRELDDAGASFDAVYDSLGIDAGMRERLHAALVDLIPVKGLAALEATTAVSMMAGVLVGLLIADSSLPMDELDLPVAPLG